MAEKNIKKLIQDDILSGKYVVVICDENEILYSSDSRGIKPIVEAYDSKLPLGLYAGDKVVGKAAAQIFHLIGIKYLYAGVISKPAYEYIKTTDIEVEYAELTDRILNRDKDGMCPMEEIALHSNDDKETLIKVKEKLQELTK